MAAYNIQKFYAERDTSGPEFDDALIRLVRVNPAIYDVNHPHYRRNPVRVAIWDRLAQELEAPSKFLQTKWKNIRYNYLQEMKVLETGHPNANIRKRRFTEDLSFLQNTAQTYSKRDNSKNASYNSSDNESNSYMCGDPPVNSYEIIELDQSDEEDQTQTLLNKSCASTQNETIEKSTTNNKSNNRNNAAEENNINHNEKANEEPQPDVTIEHTFQKQKRSTNYYPPHPTQAQRSYSSSPLLTPLVVMGNGHDEHELVNGSNEVTIEPILKINPKKRSTDDNELNEPNNAKRNSLNNSFPEVVTTGDPVELYCLSLVDTLKSMTRSERERVKFEFSKILKDAKYKDQS